MHSCGITRNRPGISLDRQTAIVSGGVVSNAADRPDRSWAMAGPVALVLRCMGTAILLGAIGSSRGAAQSIDYQAMEQLFGEPVTSSATGKPQRESDAPVNIEIVTQDDIRRSGATSIPDVLQFVTGVDVRRYGIAGAEVGIRGYNQPYNPRLLVLVNGRQVYSDDFGHVDWPTIPVQLPEIRQIEVIKGPNSALYGFNAVSGVINIITYDPLRDKINTATLQGGTQNYLGATAVGTGQIGDRAGLRISLGGYRTSEFALGSLPYTDSSNLRRPEIGALNIDGRVRVAPDVEGFVEASVTDSRYAEKEFAGSFDTNFTRTNSLRAGVIADTPFGLLSLSAYRNQENVSLLSAVAGGSGLSGSALERVYVVQASDLVKLGTDHTFRLGLEYRNNSATSPDFFNGSLGYEVYAANLMWNWQIRPDLSWTNAVRVDALRFTHAGTPIAGSGVTLADYNGEGTTVPSFNSGIVFNLTQKDTLRLMVARGVQVPSLVDFGLQLATSATGGAVVTGNPDLNPSTVDSIELDYDRVLARLGSTMRIAIYGQRNRNLLSEPTAVQPYIGPTGLTVLQSANVGNSNAAGTEIGIKGHSASGLRWQASYAFVITTDGTNLNRGGLVTSVIDFGHSVPRHVIVGGIGYTRDRLEMDLLGRWQSSYRDYQTTSAAFLLQPVNVDNYVMLTARIGYRVTDNILAAITVQQFNTSRLLQTAGPPVERRAIASLTVHF